jgi:hypothetical protein
MGGGYIKVSEILAAPILLTTLPPLPSEPLTEEARPNAFVRNVAKQESMRAQWRQRSSTKK